MGAATKNGQNVWITSGQNDFLQLMQEGGNVLGWIDYNGLGQGTLAGLGGGVTSLNSLSGALTLAAGANITITPSGSTITIAGPNFADSITPTGSAPGSSFTLPSSPNPAASLQLFWNGVLQKSGGVDYTLVGSTITTVQTVQSGDSLLAWYRH